MFRHVAIGGAVGAAAPPYFGRSEGAALLPAPPRFLDFATCMMLCKKSLNNGSFFLCLLFYLVCEENEIHTINI
jgi:hypothetical protein